MTGFNMNNITEIPTVIPPTVPTINIDKSVFWAFMVGLAIGILSNDKPIRIEINI